MMIMVKAGAPVDAVIDSLTPLLEKGDLIMDGGNSYFPDTERRQGARSQGFTLFGRRRERWRRGRTLGTEHHARRLGSCAGRCQADSRSHRRQSARRWQALCCLSGPGGAGGNYVKMVHNGIEYGDMQLIAEAYNVLQNVVGLSSAELAEVFSDWNKGELDSFLIGDHSADLPPHRRRDWQGVGGTVVMDKAAQKGTGKWTSQDAFNVGAPIPTINTAVSERIISSLKDERVNASKVLPSGTNATFNGDKQAMIDAVRQALRQQDQRLCPRHGTLAHRQPGIWLQS